MVDELRRSDSSVWEFAPRNTLAGVYDIPDVM